LQRGVPFEGDAVRAQAKGAQPDQIGMLENNGNGEQQTQQIEIVQAHRNIPFNLLSASPEIRCPLIILTDGSLLSSVLNRAASRFLELATRLVISLRARRVFKERFSAGQSDRALRTIYENVIVARRADARSPAEPMMLALSATG